MKVTKDTILAALPKLQPSELTEINLVVRHLLGLQAATEIDKDPVVLRWFDAMTAALGVKLNYSSFTPTSGHRFLVRYAPLAESFLCEVFPASQESKVMAHGLSRFLVGLLIDDLKERRIPISIGTLATHLIRIPAAFENSFPDYRASNLAHLIPEAMKKGAKHE